jgi:siroheme synthase-like protein
VAGSDAAGLPLLVDLTGLRVVVVGAGPVAAVKLRSLKPAGASVTVVAPEATDELRGAAAAGLLTWEQRRYAEGDLEGAVLVVAATSDAEVNDAVAAEARVRSTLCVRVDAGGSASLMGAVRRGPLTVAVASGVPALSRRIRGELGAAYGEEWGVLAALLGELRGDPEVRARLAGTDDAGRAARWRSILDSDILSLIRLGRIDSAKEVALACLSSSSG